MSRVDISVFRKFKKLVLYGPYEFSAVSRVKVRAAHGLEKQCISGKDNYTEKYSENGLCG